ncbi:hypothetical protein Rhow_002725 [Rhodococcus wratislaviensis]|uniref:Uncharacterized protein n=1 Tax=Rhodococcus wratislaviensis TaxID=44752 RepID=A0A402C6H3_RHOWR|nr:hypothetical protein Rhow_002725 [Rhodococcus wratislaviensis]
MSIPWVGEWAIEDSLSARTCCTSPQFASEPGAVKGGDQGEILLISALFALRLTAR